jgi:DNA-binding LacI/PurR family transcriptional regulator
MATQPTIVDVAKKCGYSKSTVSLVLQGSREIPETTAIEVKKAIKSLGYRHNRFARSLRTRRSHVVGMLIQDHLNPFYAEIVYRVEQLLRDKGFDLIVSSSNTDLKLERQAMDRLFDHQVDGLIVSALDYGKVADRLASFEERGTHCVVAGPPANEIPFDSATIDLAKATRSAMDHLLDLNHTEIAFLWGAPAFQGIGSRFSVFEDAFRTRGLVPRPEWIVHCGFRLKDGYAAAHALLKARNRPTAIFALNDVLAVGVVAAAYDLGLNVPKDISVIGVDNVEITSYMRPSLTTVSQPINRYAEALANLVLDGIANHGKTTPRRILLPADLIIRESTGPAL